MYKVATGAGCGPDWVSPQTDSVEGQTWRGVQRPAGVLHPDAILDGAREFSGGSAIEVMLVEGVNDSEERLRGAANATCRPSPVTAY